MGQHNDDNLLGVLNMLWRWRKPLMTVTGIAAIGSIIVSFLLPVYYTATTTFYPANPGLKSPVYLFGDAQEVLSPFGSEDDLDRLLTFAESKELTDFIIDKFDLIKVYKIDTTKADAPYRVRKSLFDLYTAMKNPNGAIEISVEDKDKERARDMANTILQKIDELDRKSIKEREAAVLRTLESELISKDEYLNTMRDSITRLRKKYGIYDVEAQSEFISKTLPALKAALESAKARRTYFQNNGGARDSINNLSARIRGYESSLSAYSGKNSGFSVETFNEGREQVLYLQTFLDKYYEELTEQREHFRQYRSVYESDISSVYVTERAFIPSRKSYPIRWVIVVGATLVTFLFLFMGILFIEQYKDVKWKEVFSDVTQ